MELIAPPLAGLAAAESTPARASGLSREKMLVALTLCGLLALGIFLRVVPTVGYHGVGYDEHGYAVFVHQIQKAGILNYDAVVRVYVERQNKLPDAVVPATRIGFLAPATLLAETCHLPPLAALRLLSGLTSIALLLVTAALGYRLGGVRRMLVLTALMATAPLQIDLAQRALIDGYFAFWAVLTAWFFWESLQAPQRLSWLAAYGASLFVLVVTKENAAFVFAALMATALILCAIFQRKPSISLMAVSVISPILAVLFLASLFGGVSAWVTFYRMFAAKSATLHYAIQMQDGAWYRYLVDLAILSPAIVALTFGRIFQLGRSARADLFWALFLGFSFLGMASVRYGMSLRFAAYWDEPLRWLAASQLIWLARRISPSRSVLVLTLLVILSGVVDLSQYQRLFVTGRIYDPVTVQLMHASDFLK